MRVGFRHQPFDRVDLARNRPCRRFEHLRGRKDIHAVTRDHARMIRDPIKVPYPFDLAKLRAEVALVETSAIAGGQRGQSHFVASGARRHALGQVRQQGVESVSPGLVAGNDRMGEASEQRRRAVRPQRAGRKGNPVDRPEGVANGLCGEPLRLHQNRAARRLAGNRHFRAGRGIVQIVAERQRRAGMSFGIGKGTLQQPDPAGREIGPDGRADLTRLSLMSGQQCRVAGYSIDMAGLKDFRNAPVQRLAIAAQDRMIGRLRQKGVGKFPFSRGPLHDDPSRPGVFQREDRIGAGRIEGAKQIDREDAADRRGALQDRLRRAGIVDPGGQQIHQGVGNRLLDPTDLERPLGQLVQIERNPPRLLDQAGGIDAVLRAQRRQHPMGIALRQRMQRERLEYQPRKMLAQLGILAAGEDQTEPGSFGTAQNVLQYAETGDVEPVQILEDHHPVALDALQGTPEPGFDPGLQREIGQFRQKRRAFGQTHDQGQAHPIGLGQVRKALRDLGKVGCQRFQPPRDPVLERLIAGAALDPFGLNRGGDAGPLRHVLRHGGLADPRLPDDQHRHPGGLDRGAFLRAPDQVGRSRRHVAMGGYLWHEQHLRLCETLQDLIWHRRQGELAAQHHPGAFSDHHAAGCGQFLHPLGKGRHRPGDPRPGLARHVGAHRDLSGGDAGAQRESALPRLILRQFRHRAQRRIHRFRGRQFIRARQAEHRHDSVAQIFGHLAAIDLDDLAAAPVIFLEPVLQIFRIGGACDFAEPDQIQKDRRDLLPLALGAGHDPGHCGSSRPLPLTLRQFRSFPF